MKLFILIFMLVMISVLSAQEWSEPINISNTEEMDSNPEFCIDNNGVLHCVWRLQIEANFRKIYYSKSEDEGETWSEPLNISQNNELWMGLPHIVSDSQNNLYVAYLHNVAGTGDTPRIYFTKFDGTSWCQPYCISEQYGGVGMSDVVVDNNDRVYVFWHWGGLEGEIYYRYLENDEWSDIICPYENNSDHYCLAEAVSDDNNNLHCIIDHHPEEIGSRTSYIKYDYYSDTWEDAIILAERRCQQGKDINLDTNDFPHLVWREYTNDSIPPNDGTFYSYYDGANFSEPEILVEDPWWQVIEIDGNNVIHIVEAEKYDTGSDIVKNLVYYNNSNNIWEGNIIFESDNSAGLPKIDIFEDKLYLIFFNSNDVTESDIYFMQKEIDTIASEENIIQDISHNNIKLSQNYPNPFNPQTKINFSLRKGGKTTLKIFNVKGQLVKLLVNEHKQKGDHSVIWNGTDMQNRQVSSGVYYYRLQVENRVKTKSLTLVK
ncbi:MAG: hypothetical protein APR54_04245 [Candidatus Cloacimonas sp. SDB]|nr:MAG: hypothetical protein APR54_04245 [Candidatus Cloacimonas sp. SDB]